MAVLVLALAAAFVPALLALREGEAAAVLPSGFTEEVVLRGLTAPTAVQFSPDGRVFVAEKSGVIKVFDDLYDSTPVVFADLRPKVHDFWDRGLLGLALDPRFPARPYVYALYTHNAAIGGAAPRWPDACPDPPGATGDGCVVSGRLSRLQADGNVMTGPEQVLIEDWCQQYPSHTVGSLAFGADGALYVSAGDGASFIFSDYGQDGNPRNPCGDPPTGVGGAQTPPTAQGGALRSQDLRTSGDPVGLDGAVLRVNPDTGQAAPGNPLFGNSDPNARRIVAYGLRNPFRFAVRPGTNEVWLGDVGWKTFEEIDRIPNPADATVDNFGWPCYEGAGRQDGYDGANLSICENLYGAAGAVTAPYFTYDHSQKVVAGETCPTGGSSIAGMAFYEGGPYPDKYDGALFFADYSRKCIWAMLRGRNGLPDPATRETFVAGATNPVGLQIGPGGDLFYVDLGGGTIRRVRNFTGNQPPTAVAKATPTQGGAPLTVSFDGSGSSDPTPGETLTYAWDLDGDGAYDDSALAQPTYTYGEPGDYTARLRVIDGLDQTATDSVRISVGDSPPVASIDTPSGAVRWKVGDEVSFSGSATDRQDGALQPASISWALTLHHCSRLDPSSCHAHPLQVFEGAASGSFVAPDHDYPSYLELSLTATDSGGLQDTQTVRLDPQTVELTFDSAPEGLQLVVGDESATTPFNRTVIVGSNNSVSGPSPQSLAEATYVFDSWSNGGEPSHNIVAGAEPSTYTAAYALQTATSLGSLSASSQTLQYGGATTLSGKLVPAQGGSSTSGKSIILESRAAGTNDEFVSVADTVATTAGDGSFYFAGIKPQRNTEYRARFAGDDAARLGPSASTPVRVDVRVAVTVETSVTKVRLKGSITFSGTVSPRHVGSVIRLTIKRNGQVTAAPSVRLDSNSRFRYTYRPPRTGSYGVVASFATDSDHLGNTSSQRGFTVTRR